jgi:hypothetical protein
MILSVLVAFVLCSSSAQAQKIKPLSDPELAQITARGRMLEDYDTASWRATDALLALKPAQGTVGRYIARKTDAGWVVVFGRFSEAKDAFWVVYEATQASSRQQFTVKTYDPPEKDIDFFYRAAGQLKFRYTTLNSKNGPTILMFCP